MQLRAPQDVTCCSLDGVEYPVEGGLVTVPDGRETALVEHGFVLATDPATVGDVAEEPTDEASGRRGKGRPRTP